MDSKKPTRSGFSQNGTVCRAFGYRISFDASFSSDLGRSVSGIVAHNPMVEVFAIKQVTHEFVSSAFAAEGLACLEAVRMGTDLGIQRVTIEGDAIYIILKSRSDVRDKSVIRAIIFDIHTQKRLYQEIRFDHVPRDLNYLAHDLAVECFRMERNTTSPK